MTLGKLTSRDNASPHTAARSRTLLEHFNWELFDHPPYSSDFAARLPSVYLPEELGGITGLQTIMYTHSLMEGVKTV
jgi:hypothetical protein